MRRDRCAKDRTASQEQPHRGRRLIALNVAAVAGLVGVASVLLSQTYRDAAQRGEIESRSLVQMLGRDLARNIELYDLSLRAVADNNARPDVTALPPDLRRLVLFDRAATAPGFEAILVTNASGVVTLNSSVPNRDGFNFAASDTFRHFVIHLDDDGLHVGAPMVSSFSGQWIIPMSRRLTGTNGQFAGVVAGAIKLDYLRSLFTAAGADRFGTVTLFGPDNTVLMRAPFEPELIGTRLTTAPSIARMRAASDGTFVGPAVFGDGERRFTFGRLEGGSLLLSIAVRPSDAYAGLRWQTFLVSVSLLVLCAITIGMTCRLTRELNRRRRIEDRLERANAELTALARTDELTGLANRRCFDEALTREWARASRLRRPLALVLVDADYFKGFNDACGHQGGDAALRLIGRVLVASVRRPGDLACRIGGEEFALLLPDTDASGASIVAERARSAVRNAAVAHVTSPLGVLTVSCGIASVPQVTAQDAATIFAAADTALYEAKANGRDRVAFAASARRQLSLVS